MQRALCGQLHHFQCPLPEIGIRVCNMMMMMMSVLMMIVMIMMIMFKMIIGFKDWYYGSSEWKLKFNIWHDSLKKAKVRYNFLG